MYQMHFLQKSQGKKVIQTENGNIEVEIDLHEKPDTILPDIQLHEMHGYEIVRIFRSPEEGKTILIIAETSYAIAGDREHFVAAGIADSIEKSINPATYIDQERGIFIMKVKNENSGSR